MDRPTPAAPVLPSTDPLTESGDPAARMVAGIGAFLDRELARAAAHPVEVPVPGTTRHAADVEEQRRRAAEAIGAVDPRVPRPALELVTTTTSPSLVGRSSDFEVHEVRWPVLEGVHGEGLLLQPTARPRASVVVLPDADWSPEQFVGLVPDLPRDRRLPCALAQRGCAVVVPTLIDRDDRWSGNPRIRMTNQPHREYVYRMAFQVGRHVIGYEVQRALALIDAFAADANTAGLPVGVYGYGEGGLVALWAAALDPRIRAAGVSGYFGGRARVWREPIYRNVWGLLRGLDDAHLAALVAPRTLVVEACQGPAVSGPPLPRQGRQGAAPGALTSLPPAEVRQEVERARSAFTAAGVSDRLTLVEPSPEEGPGPGTPRALAAFLRGLGLDARPVPPRPLTPLRATDAAARQRRQFRELCEFTQGLVRRCADAREAFWTEAGSVSAEGWDRACERHRATLWDDVIGRLPPPSLPPRPRTRLVDERPRWVGYEVMLDLWADVFAYGILLVPRAMRPGERRPTVVCQHGLEGRPQDTVGGDPDGPYRNFAARLAERGYVVYAPQNPYIGGEAFRQLQRKANPLGWSLFSFILAQHDATLTWLCSLPFVDEDRIGFYGLSYGGKTAMRVPSLLKRYALSICSGDFNEWIVKTTSEDLPMSYMFTGEYEMPEFNLAHRFNYAELASMIAPRPFMVERGHHDGVALDEWVAFEYAKVRRLYADLGIPERTEIAYFHGGHWIHGEETFAFLDRHLGPVAPAAPVGPAD